jgi:hypothetical protein
MRKESDLKVIAEIADRSVAEDIQMILEESGIYSILDSDNPASSMINVYSGLNPFENISLRVNRNDFDKAAEVLGNTQYHDLVPKGK